MIKEIGAGSYGRVYRVKNKITGDLRACKQLTKGRIANADKFKLEIDLMIEMDHPNIIKLYEVFEDNRYIYLIMEECLGGELFDKIITRVQSKNLFSEKEAAGLFQQLMSSMCYCHANKICHRDLKPENLLLLNGKEDSPLKVIDFGLSKIFKENDHKMTTKVGTVIILIILRLTMFLQKFLREIMTRSVMYGHLELFFIFYSVETLLSTEQMITKSTEKLVQESLISLKKV